MSDEIEANAPLQSDPTEEVSIDLQREKDSVSAHQADDSGLDKIKDALDRYTELKKEKKPGGALVVLAALLVAVSLFIGITTGLSEMSGGGSG
ncbi:MAG: hypothetical protein ACPG7Q_07945, partial [Candidatus Poseidoniaceae archaeon]